MRKPNKKQIILYSVLSFLVIILIVVLVGVSIKKEEKETSGSQSSEITSLKLEEATVPEIDTLVADYYKNLLSEGESVIESYNNLVCHLAKGPQENSYIVFAYWEVKLVNTLTLAPGIETFYVRKSTPQGEYAINSPVPADAAVYINALQENEQVRKLFEETEKKYQEAVNSDANLKAFNDYINSLDESETASTAGEEKKESGN